MKAAILSQTDWLVFPLIAVVMFTIIFASVLLWIMRPGARSVYQARSEMVFDSNERSGVLDNGGAL